jgi:hypothetical protein
MVALLVFSCCLLPSCSRENDVEVIRQLVNKAAKEAEAHDIGGLMKLTTEDFIADPGGHDRRAVRGILFRAFAYYKQFRLVYPQPSVELASDDKTAAATVYFLIVRKDISFPELDSLYHDPQGWLDQVGENADLYRLHLKLGKKEGKWLVRLAQLESFTGVGFREE